MDSRMRVVVSFVVLVMIVLALYVFSDWFSKTTGYVLGEDQKAAFVNCLSDKGAILYTSGICIDCNKQKELFGAEALSKISVIECGSDLCGGLRRVPAWQINGQFYYGYKDFQELSDLSGCALKK